MGMDWEGKKKEKPVPLKGMLSQPVGANRKTPGNADINCRGHPPMLSSLSLTEKYGAVAAEPSSRGTEYCTGINKTP